MSLRTIPALIAVPFLLAGETAEPRMRRATIWSEGTRMSAEIYAPQGSEGKRLPTVIMSHGWGGTAAGLRRQAAAIAKAGYLVVAFDYRGWGQSESRVILEKPGKAEKPGGVFTAEVREVREVVDPIDQATDIENVVHWAHGEPECDPKRIGLWGTSYSGGHVVRVAARDHRVRALVSQVGGMDSRSVVANEKASAATYDAATRRARGELGYPPPRAVVIGKLQGGPVAEKMIHYAPVEEAGLAPACAMLFLIAEKEELFDNRNHAVKAHAAAKGPKKLVVMPGITHYGIYNEAREEATRLAIEWFDAYLKN